MKSRITALQKSKLNACGLYVLDLLQKSEQKEFIAIPELLRALEFAPRIRFIAFSCLAPFKGKQELKINLFETLFFKKFHKDLLAFGSKLVRGIGNTWEFVAILQDLEPIRTWGWDISQAEITDACRLIQQKARKDLPSWVRICLYSELEYNATFEFNSEVQKMAQTADRRILNGEIEHIRKFPARFPEIFTRGKAEDIALRQVTSYALEGRVLDWRYPEGILLQTESPSARKDKMYSPLRITPLPIVHPFPFE